MITCCQLSWLSVQRLPARLNIASLHGVHVWTELITSNVLYLSGMPYLVYAVQVYVISFYVILFSSMKFSLTDVAILLSQ